MKYEEKQSVALVDCVWNAMAHAQKPDFVFRRNGRVRLIWWGRQFSLLLAAEVCASAVVMLDTPCSEVVWRVVATHSSRQFPLHFPSRVSPHFNWTLSHLSIVGYMTEGRRIIAKEGHEFQHVCLNALKKPTGKKSMAVTSFRIQNWSLQSPSYG